MADTCIVSTNVAIVFFLILAFNKYVELFPFNFYLLWEKKTSVKCQCVLNNWKLCLTNMVKC
jgi:hypothetical protein